MKNQKWLVANFHTKAYDKVPDIKRIVLFFIEKNKEKFEKWYYYASYMDSQKKNFDHHFKIHIFNPIDENKMKEEFEKIKNGNRNLISDLTYDDTTGEPTLVDGINDRFLASYGRELKEVLLTNMAHKPSLQQMQIILHYLFNQMDYGYIDEINVYLPLIQSYTSKLPEDTKNKLKKILKDMSEKL